MKQELSSMKEQVASPNTTMVSDERCPNTHCHSESMYLTSVCVNVLSEADEGDHGEGHVL